MSDLAGRRILVTGAAVGIGQGIAIELARQGAAVAAHAAHSDPAATLERAGPAAVAVRGDLSRVDHCRRVVDEAATALGGLDGLVNNAAVTRELAFEDTDPATFAELFDLNVRGYFYCAQRGAGALRGGRRDRQHRLDSRPRRIRAAHRLRGDEGRHRSLVEGARQRARSAWSSGQCGRAGVVEVPRIRERPSYDAAAYGGEIPRAGSAHPRTSHRSSPSCLASRELHHRSDRLRGRRHDSSSELHEERGE